MFKYFRDLLEAVVLIAKQQRIIIDHLDKMSSCVVTSPEMMRQPRIRVDDSY